MSDECKDFEVSFGLRVDSEGRISMTRFIAGADLVRTGAYTPIPVAPVNPGTVTASDQTLQFEVDATGVGSGSDITVVDVEYHVLNGVQPPEDEDFLVREKGSKVKFKSDKKSTTFGTPTVGAVANDRYPVTVKVTPDTIKKGDIILASIKCKVKVSGTDKDELAFGTFRITA